MKKFICTVCGFVYDEAAGIPESGIPKGTQWQDLPEDWTCPLCGATKDEFQAQDAAATTTEKKEAGKDDHEDDLRELTVEELSALFSNLSKGCEKQYREEEAGLFSELAEYFISKSEQSQNEDLQSLSPLIKNDIDSYPNIKNISAEHNDRGALRALVWGEKVSKIVASVLNRFDKQKDSLLEHTNIYVCEICGFIYIGDEDPAVCPVCKVPKMKISKIAREVV